MVKEVYFNKKIYSTESKNKEKFLKLKNLNNKKQ